MRWRLAHETHAIERVTATLAFSEMIPTKPWLALLDASTRELPAEGFHAVPDVPGPPPSGAPAGNVPVAQFVISFGPGAMLPGQIGGVPSARIFQKIVAGEAQDQITISRNAVSFTTTCYAGWDDFVGRMESTIFKQATTALQTVSISVIKLEYWDRFVFDGANEEVDYSEVLNSSSKYVPQFGISGNGLWHSHVGFFADAGASERRLINLNVDVIDIAEEPEPEAPAGTSIQRRSVGIYSMAQDTMKSDGAPESAAAAISTLNEMHTTLKEVLAEAITQEAAERISLFPQV